MRGCICKDDATLVFSAPSEVRVIIYDNTDIVLAILVRLWFYDANDESEHVSIFIAAKKFKFRETLLDLLSDRYDAEYLRLACTQSTLRCAIAFYLSY
jgi:hypothetical protein